jgi:predicted MFS family arabinose efflux permease
MIRTRSASAAIVLSVIGAAGFLIMPVVLAVTVARFQLNENEVGFMASLLMTGGVLSAVSALFWVRLLDWRLAARIGLGLQGLGLAAVMFADGFTGAGVAYLCASFGGGVVYSLALTVLSDHHSPDRMFGYSVSAQVAFQVAGMLTLSWFAGPNGLDLLIGCLLSLVLLGLVLTPLLPPQGNPVAAFSLSAVLQQGRAVSALLGCLLFFFNVGCVWAYIETIGSAAGFAPAVLGRSLALGVSAGMAGALAAAWQGERFGHVQPLLVGAVGTVLAVAFLTPAASLVTFIVALALYNFVWNYSLTYQYAVVAAADESGRCVAIAPAFHAAGGALGPAVAGMLVAPGSFVAVNLLAAGSVVVSLLLFLPAAGWRLAAGAAMQSSAAAVDSKER